MKNTYNNINKSLMDVTFKERSNRKIKSFKLLKYSKSKNSQHASSLFRAGRIGGM